MKAQLRAKVMPQGRHQAVGPASSTRKPAAPMKNAPQAEGRFFNQSGFV